jgi:hypothetical protein
MQRRHRPTPCGVRQGVNFYMRATTVPTHPASRQATPVLELILACAEFRKVGLDGWHRLCVSYRTSLDDRSLPTAFPLRAVGAATPHLSPIPRDAGLHRRIGLCLLRYARSVFALLKQGFAATSRPFANGRFLRLRSAQATKAGERCGLP